MFFPMTHWKALQHTARSIALVLHFAHLLYIAKEPNYQTVINLASPSGALPQICNKWQIMLYHKLTGGGAEISRGG